MARISNINQRWAPICLSHSGKMKVKELYVHPVKSLGGISVPEVVIDAYGIHNDRIYMVTVPSEEQGKYKMLTQREFTPMSLIEAEMDSKYIKLYHRHGSTSLLLPLEHRLADIASSCPKAKVMVWSNEAEVYDVGQVTGFKLWWKEIFGDSKYADASLVVAVPTGRRNLKKYISEEHAEEIGRTVENTFQDLYPGHLLGTASLDDLNQRLVEESKGAAHKVTARNFRPNIVAETEEPYDEDFWEIFKTGQITWYTSQLCPRCPIPTIDTETGQTSKVRQPTKTMSRYRKLEPRDLAHPSFGISISNKETSGVIRVGDPIEVVQMGSRY